MTDLARIIGKKNRWEFSALGARMVGWEGLDGDQWRRICRGDGARPASEDAHRAAIMFPWVNRIGGDHWSLDGEPVPLDLSGPLTHLHGRVANARFKIVESAADRVVFRHVHEPEKFYPRRVEVTVTYLMLSDEEGEALEIAVEALNLETDRTAYVTMGTHPYFLNPFGGTIDEMTLEVAMTREFAVDERYIPTGLGKIQKDHDFRTPRVIGDTFMDWGFQLESGADPAARLSVKNFVLKIHPVEYCAYMQIYIPPSREEIALEPQSGGADAFRVPQFGLKRLAPGERFEHRVMLAATFR